MQKNCVSNDLRQHKDPFITNDKRAGLGLLFYRLARNSGMHQCYGERQPVGGVVWLRYFFQAEQ